MIRNYPPGYQPELDIPDTVQLQKDAQMVVRLVHRVFRKNPKCHRRIGPKWLGLVQTPDFDGVFIDPKSSTIWLQIRTNKCTGISFRWVMPRGVYLTELLSAEVRQELMETLHRQVDGVIDAGYRVWFRISMAPIDPENIVLFDGTGIVALNDIWEIRPDANRD